MIERPLEEIWDMAKAWGRANGHPVTPSHVDGVGAL